MTDHMTNHTAANTAAPRYDMYRLIHKAMRAQMADTLLAVGTMDHEDTAEVAERLARVRQLAAQCRSHLDHENTFVHTAMEARAPGSSHAVGDDHDHHVRALDELEAAVAAVEGSRGDARAAAAHALYRSLAVFVGENLTHMEVEEGAHNAVLWSTHRDEELRAIEGAIVASQPPEEAMFTLRWMIGWITPAERAAFLGGLRAVMPPEVFGGILEMARATLSPTDSAKLSRTLEAPALAA